jgi:hypothetical protein
MNRRLLSFDEFDNYSSLHRASYARPTPKARPAAVRGSAESGHREKPKKPEDIQFGDVLLAPNELLGITNARTVHHPCACLCEWGEWSIALLVGTDGERLNPRYRSEYVCVDATPGNGLQKSTAFRRAPIKRPFRPVARLYPDWHLGCLDEGQQKLVFDSVVVQESTEHGKQYEQARG